MTRFASGTPILKDDYQHMTVEQLAALETLKDDRYALGIARAEYVDQAMLPDGTLTSMAEIESALDDALTLALQGDPTADLLKLALALAEKKEELLMHMAQHRFLFMVDADGLPKIYFQCAVEGNPDCPELITTDDHRDARELARAYVQHTIATYGGSPSTPTE